MKINSHLVFEVWVSRVTARRVLALAVVPPGVGVVEDLAPEVILLALHVAPTAAHRLLLKLGISAGLPLRLGRCDGLIGVRIRLVPAHGAVHPAGVHAAVHASGVGLDECEGVGADLDATAFLSGGFVRPRVLLEPVNYFWLFLVIFGYFWLFLVIFVE